MCFICPVSELYGHTMMRPNSSNLTTMLTIMDCNVMTVKFQTKMRCSWFSVPVVRPLKTCGSPFIDNRRRVASLRLNGVSASKKTTHAPENRGQCNRTQFNRRIYCFALETSHLARITSKRKAH